MKGLEFIRISRSIERKFKSKNESLTRTLISRYYYGVFHEVKSKLERKLKKKIEGPRIHNKILYFSKRTYGEEFFLIYRSLLNFRVKSDYILEQPVTYEELKVVKFLSKKIISYL
ncbi:MAG: hypothetical protein ABIL76_01680 [candidate division WOR-3 bacterium]